MGTTEFSAGLGPMRMAHVCFTPSPVHLFSTHVCPFILYPPLSIYSLSISVHLFSVHLDPSILCPSLSIYSLFISVHLFDCKGNPKVGGTTEFSAEHVCFTHDRPAMPDRIVLSIDS